MGREELILFLQEIDSLIVVRLVQLIELIQFGNEEVENPF